MMMIKTQLAKDREKPPESQEPIVVQCLGGELRVPSWDALIDASVRWLTTFRRGSTFDRPLRADDEVIHGRLLLAGSDAALLIDKGEIFCVIDGEPAEPWHPINAFAAKWRDAIVDGAARLSFRTSAPILLIGRWTDLFGIIDETFVTYLVTVLGRHGWKTALVEEGWFTWDQKLGSDMISCTIGPENRMNILPSLQAITDKIVPEKNEILYDGEDFIDGVLWRIDERSRGRNIVATEPTWV
jgi:hypothetical protein